MKFNNTLPVSNIDEIFNILAEVIKVMKGEIK